MTDHECHVMVDIETTGFSIDHAAIIQIAAIRFDLNGQTDGDVFNECLGIPPGRHWEESTRKWWSEKSKLLSAIEAKASPPAEVMGRFRAWLPENAIVWAKHTHFDVAFLDSYLRQYGYRQVNHRLVRDMPTWIAAIHFPCEVPSAEIDFQGAEHDAVADAMHQIRVLTWHGNNRSNARK